MKVTALIPDSLIDDVRKTTKGKNITDSLVIALKGWLEIQRAKAVNRRVKKSPLTFATGYSADRIRAVNRKR